MNFILYKGINYTQIMQNFFFKQIFICFITQYFVVFFVKN